MIDAKCNQKCDACGSLVSRGEHSRAPRGLIGAEEYVDGKLRIAPSFHINFDFCPDSQECFAKAAMKAAQIYKRTFSIR